MAYFFDFPENRQTGVFSMYFMLEHCRFSEEILNAYFCRRLNILLS